MQLETLPFLSIYERLIVASLCIVFAGIETLMSGAACFEAYSDCVHLTASIIAHTTKLYEVVCPITSKPTTSSMFEINVVLRVVSIGRVADCFGPF